LSKIARRNVLSAAAGIAAASVANAQPLPHAPPPWTIPAAPTGSPEDELRIHTDWAQLGQYHEDNARVRSLPLEERRVVFMGDSITRIWINQHPEFFTVNGYVDRGISGQTTPQMLVRFRQDVIDLQPKVVVILAGTNDIAGNTGPMTLEQTENNLASMADLATANHIRVVLCSVLPAYDFAWHPGLEPAPKIVALNTWIKSYAAEKGYVYVDYHSAMKDQRDGLPANLSKDGVHPTPAGYAVMTPLVDAGIKSALAQ
jgi:lysophospholipase L1-like esterase